MNDTISSADINDLISINHTQFRSLDQEFTPTTLGALISLIDE